MNPTIVSMLTAVSLTALSAPVMGQSAPTDVLAACKAAWAAAKDNQGIVDPLKVDSTQCITVYEPDKTWGGTRC